MTRLDRYIFGTFLGPVLFFALVFTGILWLIQSLRLVETVIATGQSADVFLEFSLLVLPRVLIFVIPLAVFGATLFAINRLYTESELVVMFAAGRGPWSLIRPLIAFGLVMGLVVAFFTTWLMPVASAKLTERMREVRVEYSNALIVAGQFRHPGKGITFFIEDTNTAGEMRGIFLHDGRDALSPVTYSANRALFLREGERAQIVMFDGVRQQIDRATNDYSTISFARFAFDVSEYISQETTSLRRPAEYFIHEGLNPTDAMLKANKRGRYIMEAHEKIMLPLMTAALPLVAMGALLMGGYRRGGFGLRVGLGVGLVILIQLAIMFAKPVVVADAARWPVLYLPVLLTLVLGIGQIALATRPARQRGAAA